MKGKGTRYMNIGLIAHDAKKILMQNFAIAYREQQLASQIEHNQLDMVFFLRDPLSPKSHEPDVNNVIHLCDMYNIPFATNLATAELLIKALDRGDLEWREILKKEGNDGNEF